MASTEQRTAGDYVITTTTSTETSTGTGLVDAEIRKAADGAKDRLVHVERLRVNSYSGFFYSMAWISSRVRLKGYIGRRVQFPGAADTGE